MNHKEYKCEVCNFVFKEKEIHFLQYHEMCAEVVCDTCYVTSLGHDLVTKENFEEKLVTSVKQAVEMTREEKDNELVESFISDKLYEIETRDTPMKVRSWTDKEQQDMVDSKPLLLEFANYLRNKL